MNSYPTLSSADSLSYTLESIFSTHIFKEVDESPQLFQVTNVGWPQTSVSNDSGVVWSEINEKNDDLIV